LLRYLSYLDGDGMGSILNLGGSVEQ
jgi:hypothetical protein